jgi:outer membrane protein TolC
LIFPLFSFSFRAALNSLSPVKMKTPMEYRNFFSFIIGLYMALTMAGCAPSYDTRIPESPGQKYQQTDVELPSIPPRRIPELEEGDQLSLAQCIHIAMQNSPVARLSWQKTRSARAGVDVARADLLPQVDFSANAQRLKYQVLTEVEDQFLRTTYDAKFSVKQLLFDSGETRAKISAAEYALQQADFRHNETLLDIALRVERSYYQLLNAKALLEVARETYEQRQKHLELAQRRMEAGKSRKVEVLQAKAKAAESRLGVVDANDQLRQAAGQLNAAMGLNASRKIDIREVPEEIYREEMEDVDRLMAEASSQRPALKQAATEVQRLRQWLISTKRSRGPKLTASASYGYNDTHLLPEEREEYTAILSLSIPLFTGFRKTATEHEIQAEINAALRSYEQTLRDVELSVWQAYSSVLKAREALIAAEAYVESSREALRVAENEYEHGRATIVELIDAQTDMTRSKARRVRSRLDWHNAVARLERAVGRSFSGNK